MNFFARSLGVELLLGLESDDIFAVPVDIGELGFALLGGIGDGFDSFSMGLAEFVESLFFGKPGLLRERFLVLAGAVLPFLLFADGLFCDLVLG